MSQNSVFVQAVDGRYYKEPVLWGSGTESQDWWVRFDDSDDPEVIVRRFKTSSPESGKTRASKVMRTSGIKFKDLMYSQRSSRPFPPTWSKVYECYSYTFQLTGPIPIPEKFDVVVSDPGSIGECTVYGFFSEISTELCARAVLGMDIDLLIAEALMAQPFYKKSQEKVRPEICKKLYVQFPWLRELTRDNWIDELKKHPEKVTLQWRRHD